MGFLVVRRQMRICFRCKVKKELTEFWINRTKPLGREYWCKKCAKEYDKSRDGRVDRVKQKSDAALRSKKKYPYKVETRRKTELLISRGVIKKRPCDVCNNEKSETHHPDYKDPENVFFLCRQHHNQLHREGKTVAQMKKRVG